MMDVQLTLPMLLRRAETYFGGKEVVTALPGGDVDRSSWGEVCRNARHLAAVLQTQFHFKPGDRVATLAWNNRDHLEAYFGVPAAGLVLHTLNPRLHVDDLRDIFRAGRAGLLLCDDDLVDLALEVGGSCVKTFAELERNRWCCEPDDWLDDPNLNERAAAMLCFTSGTTGRPKGVLYSHRSLMLHTLALAGLTQFGHHVTEADVVCPVVPMFHAQAWGFPYLAAMVGAKLVLPGSRLDPESLLELLAAEQVTWSAGVPTVWLRMLPALELRHGPLELRAIATGGSTVPRSLIAAYERLGITLCQSAGMTETSPMALAATDFLAAGGEAGYGIDGTGPNSTSLNDAAKAGLPLPFVEVRARAETGELVPWDGETMGELELRGPWVAAGYFVSQSDHMEISEAGQPRWTDDGWLRSGDIVTIDERGIVEIRDRVKDLIKSGGEWISSIALETALMEHVVVTEAAVIAVPDPVWQERPLAIVVLRNFELNVAAPAAFNAFLATRFAKWWLPDRYEFVDELPRTATGKVDKVALRERFAAVNA